MRSSPVDFLSSWVFVLMAASGRFASSVSYFDTKTTELTIFMSKKFVSGYDGRLTVNGTDIPNGNEKLLSDEHETRSPCGERRSAGHSYFFMLTNRGLKKYDIIRFPGTIPAETGRWEICEPNVRADGGRRQQ